jgi:excisionase family DNA binding protein
MATAATQPLEQYVTLQQIVARNVLGYSTLRAKIASGELPASRVGNRLRVKESDVLALLEPFQPKHQELQED